MLYKIFKWLFFLAVRGYFRSIYIQGNDNIPKEGPIIFASNHNSAFMDPILLAVHIKQSVYFLARGESFSSKLTTFFFNLLNMIPVFRPEFSPDMVYKNKEVFQKCYDHLKKNKTIVIFPEGFSKTERTLRKIKTGLARIALGAEAQNNFELGLQIVPIGINYSNPHYFRSDVFINFGQPLTIEAYQDLYNKDEKVAVIKLTEEVKSNLEELVVIVEDEKHDKLIRQIEILYRSKLRDESKPQEKAPQDFYLSKEIVKAVEYYQKVRPKQMLNFEIKIDQLKRDINRFYFLMELYFSTSDMDAYHLSQDLSAFFRNEKSISLFDKSKADEVLEVVANDEQVHAKMVDLIHYAHYHYGRMNSLIRRAEKLIADIGLETER